MANHKKPTSSVKKIDINSLKVGSGGLYVNEINRALTVKDVEESSRVFVDLFTGSDSSVTMSMDKDAVIYKLKYGSRPEVLSWVFMDEQLHQHLNKPSGVYYILLSSGFTRSKP